MSLFRRQPVLFTPERCRTPRPPYIIFTMIAVFCFGLGLFFASSLKLTYTTEATATDNNSQSDTPTTPPLTILTDMSNFTPEQTKDYLSTTIARFIAEKQDFIEADLSTMKIRHYRNGTVDFEAPILTKGKDGSWWETPAGVYSVELKKERHFSSFGQVYTPWNMVFQGNFFIHGWPTYPDGTPVSSQFSGGCIRLADKDAEALYRLIDNDTPVVVYENDYSGDDFVYSQSIPTIDSRAYLVADIKSNTILAASNSTSTLPIASITKLMTALVAAEYINIDRDVTVAASSITTTSVPRLYAGQTMSGYSLLIPLLKESSNEAANVFGSILGTTRFVELMNKKALALGMASSTFVDPSGIGNGNVATARDLLTLATYLYHNRSFIYGITSTRNVGTAYTVYPFKNMGNFNPVPGLATTTFIGGKVGKTTAAKETILSVYNMNIRGEQRPIAFIVLGSGNNYEAVTSLHQYIERQYGTVEFANKITMASTTEFMNAPATTTSTSSSTTQP
jgi:serine-type D-Ala-D-Ala endopeptidase (penicillin-binding protein 7)